MSSDINYSYDGTKFDRIRTKVRQLCGDIRLADRSIVDCIQDYYYDQIMIDLNTKLFKHNSFMQFISKPRSQQIVETEWVKMIMATIYKRPFCSTFPAKRDIIKALAPMLIISPSIETRYLKGDEYV